MHWNTADLTLQFIDSILPVITLNGWHFFMLENCSSSQEKEKFLDGINSRRLFESAFFHLLISEKNEGFAGGINILAERSLRDFPLNSLWILNTDITIPHLSFSFVENLQLKDQFKLIGAFVYDEFGNKRLFSGAEFPNTLFGIQNSSRKRLKASTYYESCYCEGSCFILSNELAKLVIKERGEVFDSSLFLYCEDLELGLKLRKMGYSSVLFSDFIIYHKHSQSGGGTGNWLAFYYITRNRLKLSREYFGIIGFIAYAILSFFTRIIVNLILFRSRTGKIRRSILYGFLDGLANREGKWHLH